MGSSGMSLDALLMAIGGGPLPRRPGLGAIVPHLRHLFGLTQALDLSGPGLCLGLKRQRTLGLWHLNAEGLGAWGSAPLPSVGVSGDVWELVRAQTRRRPPAPGKLLVPGCSRKPHWEKCLCLAAPWQKQGGTAGLASPLPLGSALHPVQGLTQQHRRGSEASGTSGAAALGLGMEAPGPSTALPCSAGWCCIALGFPCVGARLSPASPPRPGPLLSLAEAPSLGEDFGL